MGKYIRHFDEKETALACEDLLSPQTATVGEDAYFADFGRDEPCSFIEHEEKLMIAHHGQYGKSRFNESIYM